jgi:uncharacterized protein YqgC (DUF456 family)
MKEKEYPNGWLLIAYYMGLFSLLPVFGIFLGPVGGVLGIYGLVVRKKKKETRGLWMGRIAIIVGFLGSGVQALVLYTTLQDI